MCLNLEKFWRKFLGKKLLKSREAKLYKNPIASRAEVLCYLKTKKSCSVTNLHKKFRLSTKKQKLIFAKRLLAMQRDCQLVVDKDLKYKLAKQTVIVSGVVVKFKDGLALISLHDGKNAIVSKRQAVELMLDDIIEVIVSAKMFVGFNKAYLVSVKTRAWTEVVGYYHTHDNMSYLKLVRPLVPSGKIDIEKGLDGLKHKDSVVAVISNYPDCVDAAKCKIVRRVKSKNDLDLDIELALQAYNIPYVWSDEVLKEVKKVPNIVAEKDLQFRLDLRHLPFVTIDGESAKDFDDAIFVDKLPSGGWTLWVAIADVSYYVKPNSAIDLEARERANSVYFPRKVIPMLPFELSDNICSLQPKVDRLAVVVAIEFDKVGKIKCCDIQRAVIQSQARLTYEYVEKVKNKVAVAPALIQDNLKFSFELDKVLSAIKEKRGAIDFNFTEALIVYEKEDVVDIVESKRLDSHSMIENFMLCANNQIAKALAQKKARGIFRIHEAPMEDKLVNLGQFLSNEKIKFNSKILNISKGLQEALKEARASSKFDQIQLMALKAMKQANYSSKDLGHFGLAYSNYAHFTSPIRRYADLVVHRAVLDHLCDYEVPLEQVAEHCSISERRADKATRDVVDKLKCRFMEKKIGQCFVGVVVSVTNFGLFIRLYDYVVEGLLHINDLPKDYYKFNAEEMLLEGKKTKTIYKVGQKIKIQVEKVDVTLGRVDFKLTGG